MGIGKFCRLLEYLDEHLPRQLAGLGVLVRRMIGRQQDLAVRHFVTRAMLEDVGLLALQQAAALEVIQIGVEADLVPARLRPSHFLILPARDRERSSRPRVPWAEACCPAERSGLRR